MRVLFVGNLPNSRLYAVPRVLLCLGDEMVRLGHRVDDVLGSDVSLQGVPEPVRPLAFALAVAPRLLNAQRSGEYDVIAAHSGSGWVYGALRRALPSARTAYVLLSHGWEELLWRQYLEEAGRGAARLSRRHRLLYPMMHIGQARLAARLADAVVCCSSEERRDIVGSLGISKEKVYFVPNGVAREYLRRDHHYPMQASRLLCVAMWNWRKGQRYLLEAYDSLRRRHPGLSLSLVGTRVGAEAVGSALGGALPEGVRVVPEVSEEELRREYQTHDVFVLPSLFEGMSLAMLEAMAAGLPVIATAVSGALDIIDDGVTGLLVPSRDGAALARAIDLVLGDAQSRGRMAEAARARVETLTWDKVARRLVGVFDVVSDSA